MAGEGARPTRPGLATWTPAATWTTKYIRGCMDLWFREEFLDRRQK